MRLVLLGDGDSPHLLKWARALAPRVELWAASSRGFAAGFDALVPAHRRLALSTLPQFSGGNAALLRQLPLLVRWLKLVRADWINAHYLSSHGTLAWLATRFAGAPGRLVGSAWGSDILLTPVHSAAMRWLTTRVLKACVLCTSDSAHMAERMREMGAAEVLNFPFGLESLPPLPPAGHKREHLFYANRALEPVYAPQQVIALFQAVRGFWPDAELVLANDGSLRAELERRVHDAGLSAAVRFVGLLDGQAQAELYARAGWFISQPHSDSVSVSVLEAMAQGCIPLLSDLPANHELVRSGHNGWVAQGPQLPTAAELQALQARAPSIAQHNHQWVAQHGMFAPGVQAMLARLQALDGQTAR